MTKTPRVHKVETKVTVSALLSLVAGVLLAVLTAVQGEPAVLSPLPDIVQFVVIAALPPILAFPGGYAAPHTDRPVIEVPAAGDDQ